MTGTITDLLIALSVADVPAEAQGMMRLSAFDWAACGIAGAATGGYDEFVATQMALGPGSSQLISGGRASAPTAALINGTVSHALDYDDTHFAHIGHPTVAVLPAVLALAEEVGASFDDVVEAAATGVEASILVGLWLGRAHYQVGYHQTATAGAFGAVVGAARLLAIEAEHLRAALGLCASMASGVKAQFGTMGKPLNAGLAARTGVEAVLWAQAGMTSAVDGLAGPLGFGATHHGEGAAVSLPGPEWRIMQISHKFHACCHGLHAMLEALRHVEVAPERIDNIVIRTHPRWMSVCNISDPTTGLQAKFSYAQTCAMTILGQDTGGVECFTDQVTRDPDIASLRACTLVEESDSLTEMQAEVILNLKGGEQRHLHHDLAEPLPIETRAARLQDKAVALLGERDAEALWHASQGDGLGLFTGLLGKRLQQ